LTELQTTNDAKYLIGDPRSEVWVGPSVRWRVQWYCGKGSGSTDHFVWPQANDSAVTLMPAQLSNRSGHGSPGRAIRMTPVRQLQVLRASALDAQFRRVELWCARCRSKPAVRPRPRDDIASHGPSACSLSLFREGTDGAGRTGPPG
jgi:hypothetical protein